MAQIDRQKFLLAALRLTRTKLLPRAGFGRELSISLLISDVFTCSSIDFSLREVTLIDLIFWVAIVTMTAKILESVV